MDYNSSYNSLDGVFPGWSIVERIGEGSFGKVYKVKREEHGFTDYAAVKVISIPQSDAELNSLIADGYNETSARSYFESIVTDVVGEIKLMVSMKGTTNIVSIEDYRVIEKSGEIGWDIYIRMELLTSFISYSTGKELSDSEVIKLGQDICAALELCARKNIIHRDIKPENIFVSQFGDFKLGDFGIARELEKTNSSMSTKGTFNYIAPEITTSRTYDATVDIYSLGIVLYKSLNNNRLPFINPYSEQITYQERNDAVSRRLSGEPFHVPVNASPPLGHAVIKACMYDPSMRFRTATEFKQALEAVRNGTYEITPYNTENLNNTVSMFDQDRTMYGRRAPAEEAGDNVVGGVPQTDFYADDYYKRNISGAPDSGKKGKNKNALIITGIVCGLLIALAVIFAQFLTRGGCGDTSTPTPAPTESPSPPPAESPSPPPVESPSPPPAESPSPPPVESPSPPPTQGTDLYDAAIYTTNWVRLEINWGGGRQSIFERNQHSPVWTMMGRDGDNRIVDPTFNTINGSVTIGFPTTNKKYHLNSDNTGYWGNPGASDNENLTWSFSTDPLYDNGAFTGVNQTHDVIGAVGFYPMVNIYIGWQDGTTTVFYKRTDGAWRMTSRFVENLVNISIDFNDGGDYVYMSFPQGHPPYYLYTDGTGWHEEHGWFDWHYNFSDR